jgi:hypothetical protein
MSHLSASASSKYAVVPHQFQTNKYFSQQLKRRDQEGPALIHDIERSAPINRHHISGRLTKLCSSLSGRTSWLFVGLEKPLDASLNSGRIIHPTSPVDAVVLNESRP